RWVIYGPRTANIREFKALETVPRAAKIPLVNDLVATRTDSGLGVNFGHSITVRRTFRTHKK
ncbi:MAG: hypothetical protein LGR52_11945, partial [Candidatus Thiosymbion ectosymbiont of Robbea hypermnestra]|nr:hypothetical protein [Candidatus Thiosymbion ectosymbiont of Robbea hypermnestra]